MLVGTESSLDNRVALNCFTQSFLLDKIVNPLVNCRVHCRNDYNFKTNLVNGGHLLKRTHGRERPRVPVIF